MVDNGEKELVVDVARWLGATWLFYRTHINTFVVSVVIAAIPFVMFPSSVRSFPNWLSFSPHDDPQSVCSSDFRVLPTQQDI